MTKINIDKVFEDMDAGIVLRMEDVIGTSSALPDKVIKRFTRTNIRDGKPKKIAKNLRKNIAHLKLTGHTDEQIKEFIIQTYIALNAGEEWIRRRVIFLMKEVNR